MHINHMKTRNLLLGLGLAGTALTIVVGAIGVGGMRWIGAGMDQTAQVAQATQAVTLGDMAHDAVRGDVFQALMLAASGRTDGIDKAQREAAEHGGEFLLRLQELRALELAADQRQDIDRLAPLVERYAAQGEQLTRLAGTDLAAAQRKLPEFEALFEQLAVVQDGLIEKIEAHAKVVQQQAGEARERALMAMLAATVIGGALLMALALLVVRRTMNTLGAEPAEVRAAAPRCRRRAGSANPPRSGRPLQRHRRA